MLEDMMRIISSHIMADNGDEKLVSEKMRYSFHSSVHSA